MAKQRKTSDETKEQARVRRTLEAISNSPDRPDKVAWNRKYNNLLKLVSSMRPIERQILELMEQKQEILDQVAELRQVMVTECIHPFDHLVHNEDHAVCKFCERRLSLPNVE